MWLMRNAGISVHLAGFGNLETHVNCSGPAAAPLPEIPAIVSFPPSPRSAGTATPQSMPRVESHQPHLLAL